METARPESRSTAVAAGVALALAGCAALSFAVGDAIGFVSPNAEAVSTLSWLAGWVLLVWATLVVAAVAVHLVRAARRRRPALVEIVLVLATAAVIAGVIVTYPPAGSGAGAGW